MNSILLNKNVVFRLDSSSAIGFGHLMRCLTLASELKQRGANCYFICRDLKGNNNSLIMNQGFNLCVLPFDDNYTININDNHVVHHDWLGATWQQDAELCKFYFLKLKPDIIIVDHYSLDARWETLARSYCYKLCVIDDLADRQHDCYMLLDYNLSVNKKKYLKKVPSSCQLLLGRKYVLLRQEFLHWQSDNLVRRKNNQLSRILITFGGIDSSNNSEHVLKVLNHLKLPLLEKIDVVVSSKAPMLSSLKAYAKQMKIKTSIHSDVNNMAELIYNADLAIGSGGGSTYERIFFKLPSILMPIAKNQIKPLQIMSQQGLFELFSNFNELKLILSKYKVQNLPSVTALVLFGAPFVGELIMADEVTLADVAPYDIRRSYYWLQNEKLRRNFLLSSKPTIYTHFNYWRSLLKTDNQYVFSILQHSKHVGNLGLKNIDEEKSEVELWIYVGESIQHNRGVGTKALILLESFIKNTLLLNNVVLHVSKDNYIAQSFYKKNQYILSSNQTLELFSSENILQMRKKL